jgi:hypothetical protein
MIAADGVSGNDHLDGGIGNDGYTKDSGDTAVHVEVAGAICAPLPPPP